MTYYSGVGAKLQPIGRIRQKLESPGIQKTQATDQRREP
ncbi:Unknown protein sequence [Pseudomonas coronafaciens pv. oryzae]|nr:Unknown protein sequence [Pseudomonas coronafaciens pv. oryzae]